MVLSTKLAKGTRIENRLLPRRTEGIVMLIRVLLPVTLCVSTTQLECRGIVKEDFESRFTIVMGRSDTLIAGGTEGENTNQRLVQKKKSNTSENEYHFERFP